MRSQYFSVFLSTVISVVTLTTQSSLATPVNGPAAKKPWTFLVFLNAFNNLDRFGFSDMNEMEMIGSTENVNVVVQWASYEQKDVRRILVKKDSNPEMVTSPVVENLGKIDMGDYKNLVDFVRWGKEKYPAEQYFVAVWNHGSGWHRFKATNSPIQVNDISFDDFSGNKITTEQLGTALSDIKNILGKNLDIYGSDACLMGMAEVAGEMKDTVDVSVGSQHLEPGDGWPYHLLLDAWNKKPGANARDVAEILVKTYKESYPDDYEITLSAYDLRNYDSLANAVKSLGETIQSATSSLKAKLLTAAKNAADFSDSDYRDLVDFTNELEKMTEDGEVKRLPLQNVKKAVNEFVIANAVSTDQSSAHGVSIWMPIYESTYNIHSKRYKNLVFNQDTDWVSAAKTIVTK